MAATVVAFPLNNQSARAAFASVNPNLEKAARTLGAGSCGYSYRHFALGLAGHNIRVCAGICQGPGRVWRT